MNPANNDPDRLLVLSPPLGMRVTNRDRNRDKVMAQLAPLSIVLSALIHFTYSYFESNISSFIAFFFFGISGLVLVSRGGIHPVRIYLIVYGCASMACVVLATIFTYHYGTPYWSGGSDELHYEQMGTDFARNYSVFDYNYIRGGLASEWHNSVGYIYLVGLLVKYGDLTGGFHTMIPRLFNSLALALLSVVLYHTALRLKLRQNTAILSSLVVGLLPLMVWVSAQTLRDVIQALILLLIIYIWLPDDKKRLKHSIGFTLFSTIILLIPVWEIRKMQAFVIFLIISVSILGNSNSYRGFRFVFVTLPILIVVSYAVFKFFPSLNSNVKNALNQTDNYIALRSGTQVGGGLSLAIFSMSYFPFGWILRICYALVSPLPTVFWPLDKAWLSIGTICHIFFIPFLWFGAKRGFSSTSWRLIIVSFSLFFLGMSMFTFTIRHITQFLPFAVLLSAFGFENYGGRPRDVWFITAFCSGILLFLYITLKVF